MSDEWLSIDEKSGTSGLPACIALPTTIQERVALLEGCWAKLTLPQRTFLTAWRECRYNARAANRALHGRSETNASHTKWKQDPNYMTVMRVWLAQAANDALDRERILARQDDIVEEALTPKPILHQGVPTGFEEIDLGVANNANQALLDRVMPKPRADVEVNVGVVYTPPSVEVVKSAGATIDAVVEVVEVSPAIPDEE